jgi:hypothetical protein
MKLLIYQEHLNLISNSWPSQTSSGIFPSSLLCISRRGSHAIPSVVVSSCPNTETSDKPGHVNELSIVFRAWKCLIAAWGFRRQIALSAIAHDPTPLGDWAQGCYRVSYSPTVGMEDAAAQLTMIRLDWLDVNSNPSQLIGCLPDR